MTTATSTTSPRYTTRPAARWPLYIVARNDKIVLRSLDDIKQFFATQQRRTFFISPSNFNMIGMHEWVRGWHNINMLDCFNGQHPHCITIPDDHSRLFAGVEDVNHFLIDQPQVRELLSQPKRNSLPDQALFLFFDEALEQKCAALGIEVALPPNRLVRTVDSKIVTTEIANAAGVPSVPNAVAHVGSFAELQLLATQHSLGDRWVVQTAYGDSGKTTFFIDSETDYRAVAAQIEREDKVKVMRRVRCIGAAIEACATRWGTFVGPLLTELVGQSELTPYAGGWCGNENHAAAFTPVQRAQVKRKTQALGNALYARGYRGWFELDYLVDLDTQEIYLGELNARITGATALTNTSDFSQAALPLFLFHLLEFDARVDLKLNVQQFNEAMQAQGAQGISGQIILKHTQDDLRIITAAPTSGVYRIGADGTLSWKSASVRRRDALAEDESYVLRIQAEGEYAYRGGDMAIQFLNCTIRDADGQLNATGRRWVKALKAAFKTRPLTQEERAAVELVHNPANVKSARE
jgi:D-alanine-D-alanine ligase-like ATP-grasp enzyme